MTPLGADPADLASVEAIVRRSGTSFYRGMRVLPPDRRAAMYAVYAFCRIVDDIADEPAPQADKHASLDLWRRRVTTLARAGEGDDATTRVLARAARQYALRAADFLAIIDGMQQDADTEIVAPTLADLDLYCDRVASAVGRLSVRAFGEASAAGDEVAHHLGRALQLTNILRDLDEDAARGRLYLPAEYLDEAGVSHAPSAALASPGLGTVCARLARDADDHFRAAARAMRRCNRRAMRPARLMRGQYAAILARLRRRGFARPRESIALPLGAKLLVIARNYF